MSWPGLRARVLERPSTGGGALISLTGTGDNVRATELEILRLVADGLTDSEIASRLRLATRTVGTYLERIFERFDLRNRAAAAAWYVRLWEPGGAPP
jgi:DNA-binding CsgD family transcriptional regulator